MTSFKNFCPIFVFTLMLYEGLSQAIFLHLFFRVVCGLFKIQIGFMSTIFQFFMVD